MIHRQTHVLKFDGSYSWYKTECGTKAKDDRTSSDMKTTCPECLRMIIMRREQEIEILKKKLGTDEIEMRPKWNIDTKGWDKPSELRGLHGRREDEE